ncbi:hypothetical protein [Bradyrhizobium sp.]|uniref:hypothetical protein n=1 Tax=Bradyrhizobium sp. TaxID=376 RepID=UPI0025C0B848|nr:hypothetical protein [Bradyrhizobium sp.]MBV8922734.1 hypothetical protein [Bradyrhizobium sp.]
MLNADIAADGRSNRGFFANRCQRFEGRRFVAGDRLSACGCSSRDAKRLQKIKAAAQAGASGSISRYRMPAPTFDLVMAGLDPAIHVFDATRKVFGRR